MSIKAHLEQVIKNLEAEREREVERLKEVIMREKILPFNQEIDMARDKAIAEKQQLLNANIVACQEKFAKERQEIIEAGERKKEENATAVITTETYSVTVKYDKAISEIKSQVEKLEG